MRTIHKTNSPQFFEDWKKTIHPTEWNDLRSPEKERLRKVLLEEQGYICCYCQVRIHDDKNTHIEHFLPKRKSLPYRYLMFEYSNLFASCNGDQEDIRHIVQTDETIDDIVQRFDISLEDILSLNPETNFYPPEAGKVIFIRKISNPRTVHCDHKKEDEVILLNPLSTKCADYFQYDYQGNILAVNDNLNVQNAIEVLGLNVDKLKKLRKNTVGEYIQSLPKEQPLSIEEIDLLIREYKRKDPDTGKLLQFCEAIIDILEYEKEFIRLTGQS